MHGSAASTAVVELNVARRADVFAPVSHRVLEEAAATLPLDIVQYTTSVRYSSGRAEGPVTVRAPQALADLGAIERAVVAYVCTLHVAGCTDAEGAVSFTLHGLARWVGWQRPNAEQYDRIERAIETVAMVRFVQWRGYLEATQPWTDGGRARPRYEHVDVTSIFGFCDEADIETRERAASRRENDRLPANATRTVKLWINRRFRQQLDSGVSVRISLSALQRIGLKNQLAAHLYYLIASKRTGKKPVEVSGEVLEQVISPTPAWRRNLRQRAEAACRLISEADPSVRVSVVSTDQGWKVVAIPAGSEANTRAFGVPATEVRGSSNGYSGLQPQKFGVPATGRSPEPKPDKHLRRRPDHRAYRA